MLMFSVQFCQAQNKTKAIQQEGVSNISAAALQVCVQTQQTNKSEGRKAENWSSSRFMVFN